MSNSPVYSYRSPNTGANYEVRVLFRLPGGMVAVQSLETTKPRFSDQVIKGDVRMVHFSQLTSSIGEVAA